MKSSGSAQDPESNQSKSLTAKARAFASKGDFRNALSLHMERIVLLDRVPLALALYDVSDCHQALCNLKEAVEFAMQADTITVSLFGETSTKRLRYLRLAFDCLMSSKNLEEAKKLALLMQKIALTNASMSPSHNSSEMVAISFHRLGLVCLDEKDYSAALICYNEGLILVQPSSPCCLLLMELMQRYYIELKVNLLSMSSFC